MTDILFRRHIAEDPLDGRRLGRHVAHDPRSKDHPAEKAGKVVSVKHRAAGLPLNQGSLGSCTANALCGALNSEPNRRPGRKLLHERDAVKIYELETSMEGEPYPPNDPGGTGLFVCKAGKQLGLISSYKHAFGIQHALEALVLRPVITGVSWYDSFDQVDATGLVDIRPGASVRGGHEFVADEIDAPNELVWFFNSWGRSYGKGGRFCMRFSTWEALLAERGDVTVPIV